MNKTVVELAEEMYPGRNYDTALPQQWVNRMADRRKAHGHHRA
jgi:hypothetical protein